MNNRDTALEASIQTICRERNIDVGMLRAVLCDFLVSLNEVQFKSGYRTNDGCLIAQVYRALGDEAAFHLVGLLSYNGHGYDPGELYTSLEYIDARTRRFDTTVQRWQMEIDAEVADSKD